MNRWARIFLGVAVLGLAGWLGTGLHGRTSAAGSDASAFALHSQLGLVATLTLLFANSWFVVYLTLSARGALRVAGDAEPVGRMRTAARRAILAASTAILLVLAQPALAGLLFPDRLSASLHLGLALASLAAEILFLVLAVRAAALQVRCYEALETTAAPPS